MVNSEFIRIIEDILKKESCRDYRCLSCPLYQNFRLGVICAEEGGSQAAARKAMRVLKARKLKELVNARTPN